jgi:hypothetical protein
MIEQDIKKCYDLLKQNNVWDDDYDILRKNFKMFALKNHPDKGGIKEVFQSVSSCKDILDNDFGYFKDVINKKSYNYNEESVNDTYYDDGDNSADEDYSPKKSPKKSKSKKSKKSKSKEHNVYTHIDFETFVKKDCKGGRGGWLINELRNFCNILGISSKGTKEELCENLSKYFEEVETKKAKDWMNEQYDEIHKDQRVEEELRKKHFEDEMKQREELERVYREQERIRAEEEQEIKNLSDRMSSLYI